MTREQKPPVIPDDEVVTRLQNELPEWHLEGRWIRRKFTTDGWATTLMLVNAIGFLSEAAWHHPDLEVSWSKVWVKLQTHESGGITDRDMALAKMIEKTALWRPEEGSALQGTPKKWVR